MRLEEEYRRRLYEVSNAVKRRLNYQVEVEQAERRFQQEHMVQWLERTVREVVQGKQVRERRVYIVLVVRAEESSRL